jgi:hypothetical protein
MIENVRWRNCPAAGAAAKHRHKNRLANCDLANTLIFATIEPVRIYPEIEK